MVGINRDLLLYHVRTANTTYDALASEMGIDRSTLYRHLRAGSLTVAEMHSIIKSLHLSLEDSVNIFMPCW